MITWQCVVPLSTKGIWNKPSGKWIKEGFSPWEFTQTKILKIERTLDFSMITENFVPVASNRGYVDKRWKRRSHVQRLPLSWLTRLDLFLQPQEMENLRQERDSLRHECDRLRCERDAVQLERDTLLGEKSNLQAELNNRNDIIQHLQDHVVSNVTWESWVYISSMLLISYLDPTL